MILTLAVITAIIILGLIIGADLTVRYLKKDILDVAIPDESDLSTKIERGSKYVKQKKAKRKPKKKTKSVSSRGVSKRRKRV